jgi:preprotein translocase SecE subunit
MFLKRLDNKMVRETDLRRRVSSQAVRRVFSLSIIGDVIAELNRVTWPTREETTRLSIMVITVAVIVGVFLGIIDLGFSSLFNFILGNN